jgi:hypothetical protein
MNAIATLIDVEQTEKNIGSLQNQVNLLQDQIKKAIGAVRSQVEDLDNDTFWKLMDELKRFIRRDTPGKNSKYSHGVIKSATSSFIHTVIFGHVRGMDTDRQTAIAFSKMYDDLKSKLSKALWDEIEGYGDDGYGDCIDSFPLYGEAAVQRALGGNLDGLNPYQGENYVGMSLDNAIEEFYPISCRYDFRDDNEED